MTALDHYTYNLQHGSLSETFAVLRGLDLDTLDKHGNSILLLAVQTNRVDVVDELLRAEVNVNWMKFNGWTAAMSAAELGLSDVMRLLIVYDVDVSNESSSMYTPLILAIMRGHCTVIEQLLAHGAPLTGLKIDPFKAATLRQRVVGLLYDYNVLD